MPLHHVFRTINTINPTTWGKGRVVAIARRTGALPPAGVATLEHGTRMWLGSDDIDIEIYFRAFEVLCTRVILSRLRPGGCFLDVGANIGYYSLRARGRVGASGNVLAFEPNPSSFEKMRRNVDLSGAQGIRLFPYALSDFNGEAELHIHPNPAMHGFTSLKNQGWSGHPTTMVPVRQLDEVLPADVDRVDMIKIDVEGAELGLLRGARKTIDRFRPELFIELNSQTSTSFGYEMLDIPRLLLSYHADYRFKHVGPHSVREMTFDQMQREGVEQGNLLVY